MNDVKFNKITLFINALVPLALFLWDVCRGNLGADPVQYFLGTSGILTLVFLILTLSVTPLRKYFGLNQLIKFRRMLGLYAFFYGFLHLLTYSVFDKRLNIAAIAADIWKRPFIAVGMASFFLMIPLAVTSTNSMIKRLGGKNWQKLHYLIYLTAIGGVVHFYMIVKSDVTYPFLFAAVLLGLFWYRIRQKFEGSKVISAAGLRK